MTPQSEDTQDQIDRLLFSLSSLNDLSEMLISTRDFDTAMRAMLHLVLGELTISKGALCLFDRDQHLLFVQTARGLDKRVPAISMDKTWVAALVKENRPLTRTDLYHLAPELPDQLHNLPSCFLVPLIVAHQLVGVLCVSERFKQFPYARYECSLLMTMARQIAIAIYNHQLLEETKSIRTIFKRYVSDHVAEMLLQSEENLRLGGTYKEVVVVFTDLRNFTRMQEDQHPEETVTMLNEYYEEMMQVIHRHNSTITRMSGDGLMILYGAPISFEDDLARAMETVLDMRDALASLNDHRQAERKEPLSMGVGISMGRVLAGNIGSTQRVEYTVIGEPVNLAARLVDIANGGQVLISEDVFHNVRDRFSMGYVRTIELKGQARQVNIYELKGHLPGDIDTRSPDLIPTKEGEITLTVPMWPSIELMVGQAAAAVAGHLNLDDMQIEEIRLAVIEACINAVEHSESADRKIHIIVQLLEDILEVVIQDFGEGVDIDQLRDHMADRKTSHPGKLIKRGWGLTLIESLMDQVEMTSSVKGTAIRMVKKTK
jgi:class 3 adenylate cyclase/anti-sigma regulatory factor (Ser/Thr protein kinase)